MTSQPITNAVYPKGAARKKPRPERERNNPRFTVAGALGAKQIDELYRQLGFKQPDRRKGKR